MMDRLRFILEIPSQLAPGFALNLALVTGLVAVYFLPAIVAAYSRHRQSNAIFVLNLLLGWTLLGWAAALIWAVMVPTIAATPAPPPAPPPPRQPPENEEPSVYDIAVAPKRRR